jgi:hypothetical protein
VSARACGPGKLCSHGLKGKATCAKCDLKVTVKCATVLVVKEKDKEVTNYFDEKSHKDNHKTVCTGPKVGTVTGKVSEKDGQRFVTVTKAEFK